MSANPEMVSGPGMFDTRLMQVGQGKMIVKCGAEGYQIVGITPGAFGPNSPALGLAIKISDGDNNWRACQVTALHILSSIGILNKSQIADLAEFSARPLYNWRKIEIGSIRPCFEVK